MWGDNMERELGFGDVQERRLPCPLVALKAEKVKHVECGGQFTVCIGDVKSKSPSETNLNNLQTFGVKYQPLDKCTTASIDAARSGHKSSSGKSIERVRDDSSVKKLFSSAESELIYLRQKLLLATEQNKQILKSNKSLKREISKELKPLI